MCIRDRVVGALLAGLILGPAVLGNLLSGVVVGGHHLEALTLHQTAFIDHLAEIGVIVLMMSLIHIFGSGRSGNAG